MESRYTDIHDFALCNLSWKVTSYSSDTVDIGIVQNANTGHFRIVRLENGFVTDNTQVGNYDRATNLFEQLVKEERNVSI